MSDLEEFFDELSLVPEWSPAGLAIDADLRLELTTPAGASTTARVTGHGQRVRVDAERPEVLLAAVDRADVGRVAELLAATGMTVDVYGPHGPVAIVGAGTTNRFGRAFTGSSRVTVVPRGAMRLAWASPPIRTTAVAVSAALVVLAAVRAAGHVSR